MTALVVAGILFLAAAILYMARKSGMDAQGLKDEKRKNDMAQKAGRIRDRLLSDNGFAARVRKRFTR